MILPRDSFSTLFYLFISGDKAGTELKMSEQAPRLREAKRPSRVEAWLSI
jgi:hypothetical protein